MAGRRSLGEIYRGQRQLDRTVPSRTRAGVFSSLSMALIALTVLHSVPLVVKVAAWLVYAIVGVWVAVTSGRMARVEERRER